MRPIGTNPCKTRGCDSARHRPAESRCSPRRSPPPPFQIRSCVSTVCSAVRTHCYEGDQRQAIGECPTPDRTSRRPFLIGAKVTPSKAHQASAPRAAELREVLDRAEPVEQSKLITAS